MCCGSNQVKKNGFYGNGKQRWLCYRCNKSFHWGVPANKRRKERIWFERWIIEGYSVRQLRQQSGYSQSKLYRIIDYWLSHPPKENDHVLNNCCYTIFDGTFLHRPNSLVALMDANRHIVIAGSYGIRENSKSQIHNFLLSLKQKGLNLKSCAVDGNQQVIKVLRLLWPDIIVQRCLVHIQRQGLMWCRQNPKRTDAKYLRKLFQQVACINNAVERDKFIQQLLEWENRFGYRITMSSEKGWVFSDIKRARSMLLKALPDMFHYLEDHNIPKSTNSLEGYYSRLKSHYRKHRGLKIEKRDNYFRWFLFLKPK